MGLNRAIQTHEAVSGATNWTKDNLVIDPDYEIDNKKIDWINVSIEVWFDVDAKFGVKSLPDGESWVNLYADYNPIMKLHDKGFNVMQNIGKLKNLSSQEIYDFYDHELNSISISTGHEILLEDIVVDDALIERCLSGQTMGIPYRKRCPILSYLTLGLPLGDLYMLAGFSGTGKSSFVFENIILPITQNEIKCAVTVQ